MNNYLRLNMAGFWTVTSGLPIQKQKSIDGWKLKQNKTRNYDGYFKDTINSEARVKHSFSTSKYCFLHLLLRLFIK